MPDSLFTGYGLSFFMKNLEEPIVKKFPQVFPEEAFFLSCSLRVVSSKEIIFKMKLRSLEDHDPPDCTILFPKFEFQELDAMLIFECHSYVGMAKEDHEFHCFLEEDKKLEQFKKLEYNVAADLLRRYRHELTINQFI